jgi:hypothetical protein
MIIMALMAYTTASTQSAFDFQVSTLEYDGEERPCITLRLAPDTKEVKKAWEDFVKKEYKIKLKGLGFLVLYELRNQGHLLLQRLIAVFR